MTTCSGCRVVTPGRAACAPPRWPTATRSPSKLPPLGTESMWEPKRIGLSVGSVPARVAKMLAPCRCGARDRPHASGPWRSGGPRCPRRNTRSGSRRRRRFASGAPDSLNASRSDAGDRRPRAGRNSESPQRFGLGKVSPAPVARSPESISRRVIVMPRHATMAVPDGAPYTKKARGSRASSVQSGIVSDDPDVLAARTLGALTALERDGLSFAKVVEARSSARRVVEEVSFPSSARMKPKPLSLTSRLIVPFMGAAIPISLKCEPNALSQGKWLIGAQRVPGGRSALMNAGWLTEKRGCSIPCFRPPRMPGDLDRPGPFLGSDQPPGSGTPLIRMISIVELHSPKVALNPRIVRSQTLARCRGIYKSSVEVSHA